jgi:hypothetical protein
MLITTGASRRRPARHGGECQEMQLAHWISRTEIPWLVDVIPAWVGMWFAVFPTYETMIAQAIAAVLVIGSYYAARRLSGNTPNELPEPTPANVRATKVVPRFETVS